ncbi:MAG: carboxymuconolactone decarboxylase family protein [Candidatus Cloacimonetes bacterium]|jgi:AhpD family alkylhydroperoxidase|nr:carboxymuconolactone decarboxylase family protein [Candidatus Cloacimonadota bacterium]MDY0337915.1 carboxymuconolactone decarboxylase family protein [Candidatus Cloacimonadaceae bacterium]MDD2544411.1 carboxymuconolactone decarboxylase family protein [Candidatus Cloacimonadota bacterium]MDD2683894.1 carboxymuconolactone decarboxylase family protein [Candidatus Cloacimonadota bacterium]MDD3096945.1 carboxymuconolactone decarboxylase family protein [Candidatus Cloacimonadota bacterium]
MKPRDFQNERQRLTELTLSKANLEIKRFFAMDHAAYQDGALDVKTKEMLGLVASMVLRCDDCIRYHLDQCRQCGITDAELNEIFNIALVVGGSIVIPHLRRAVEYWEAGKEPTIS